jgi:hypothetical protein
VKKLKEEKKKFSPLSLLSSDCFRSENKNRPTEGVAWHWIARGVDGGSNLDAERDLRVLCKGFGSDRVPSGVGEANTLVPLAVGEDVACVDVKDEGVTAVFEPWRMCAESGRGLRCIAKGQSQPRGPDRACQTQPDLEGWEGRRRPGNVGWSRRVDVKHQDVAQWSKERSLYDDRGLPLP